MNYEDINMRKRQEQRERKAQSPFSSFSDSSKGRLRDEEPCDLRTIYQRDRDRIIHSKAFRRLKHKTQVFLSPEGDHYRTRLTHTLEVSQIARTIAKSLKLNEDLTEAIALGHDLGHTPFGHAGERALNEVDENGFCHSEQSIRVVNLIENDGKGLNLTYEVLDGIENHQTKSTPKTLEGKIVRLSDKIAYINHDIDDAIRANIIKESDIPREFSNVLGNTVKNRLDLLIHDIIKNSYNRNDIIMSDAISDSMLGLRKFMFNNVYLNPTAKGEEIKAENLVKQLYKYYYNNINKLPEDYLKRIRQNKELESELIKEKVVKDYVAGMTDRFAVATYKEIAIPSSWGVY